MKKIMSLFLCISLIMALFVPTMIFSASATTVDAGNIDLSKLEFAYALRGNAENVYPSYNETDGCYDITMPSNSKHAFLVSDTKTNGGSYTISVEYKMNSADGNAQVGFILGASKSNEVIDLTTAYKMQVYKAADRYRFSACNGATPDLVGANVSFDRNYTDKGVTYNEDVWNSMSMTVNKDGIITMTINGVLVFNQKLPGHYISGYVGLYTYVPGTQFRNFNIVEKENEIDMSEMEFGYALRGDATNTSVNYNGTNDAYDLRMPSNAKDAFYVSDTKANGNSYTVSVEYKSTSADANMCVGFVLGASKNEDAIDLSTAYKMWVYTNTDRIRFTSCDAATPRDTNGTYGRNYTGIGVTYNSDGWNKMSMTVTKEGIVTLTVNGVLVYSSQNDGTYSKGYIGGYVGLHAYLPGVQVRNFTFVEQEDEVDMSEMEFVYALRGAANNTSIKYNAANGAYDLTMPSNAKDAFFISDTKTNGGTYTVSVEYQSTSTDNNMAVGLVLGASKDAAGVIDITTAYKMCVYKNVDRAFFNSCDGATPRDNGASYSRNYTSVGVTYNSNGWNKMSMTVTKDGVVTLTVNDVLVYNSKADGKYSKGYY